MFWPEVEPGSQVRFKLADVVCPELDQVIDKLTENLEVTGRVAFLSDSGNEKDRFAIVEVNGVMCPLIVPVDEIGMFGPDAEEAPVRTVRRL